VKRVKLDKLDNFDKELIKKTVFDLFNKNECVTLRKLKAEGFIDERMYDVCLPKSHPNIQE
jgi:hypothetical protein